MNCFFHVLSTGLHVAVVALQNIEKGKELFVSYTPRNKQKTPE